MSCSLLVCRNLVRDVTHAALEGMLVKCVAQKHRWVLSLKLQLVLVMWSHARTRSNTQAFDELNHGAVRIEVERQLATEEAKQQMLEQAMTAKAQRAVRLTRRRPPMLVVTDKYMYRLMGVLIWLHRHFHTQARSLPMLEQRSECGSWT